MRLTPFGLAALAALALAAGANCGLDSGGLLDIVGQGDGGASSGGDFDATSLESDGTVNGPDGNAGGDATSSGEDGSQGDGSPPQDGSGSEDGSGQKDAGTQDASSDASDASLKDAAVPDSEAPDGNDGSVADAGPDACGSVEICNNGKDDDCDGLIDCADSQCQAGWSCTDGVVPSGWTVVTFAESSTPGSCAAGYPNATPTYDQDAGFPAASCGCSCSVGTSGSCETGNFSAKYSTGTTGPQCSLPAGPYPANSCNALPIGFTMNGNTKESGNAVPYTAGSCSANGSTNKPTIDPNGLLCGDPNPTGAGCASNGACVPKVPGGFSLCIAKSGTQTCPAGFTDAHAVGSSLNDTRGCTACTCTGPTADCNDAMVTLYSSNDCSGASAATIAFDGNCNDFALSGGATSATAHSFQYSATLANERCGSGTSTPTGGVAVSGTTTVCCQP